MASVPKNYSSTNESKPINDPANAPLFDYIHQSAKTIQRTELMVGVLTWMVLGLVTILTFVLIDQWVWPFNDIARYGVWLILVGGSLFWLFRRVIPFLGRSINPEYAAKRIEDTIPEMKDGLISWLQLASRESTPRGVLNTVGRYVAKHLQGQEVASVIDQFTSMKLAATLFGLILISAIYLAVSPKSGVVTISRLFMPWANISPSTRVQILQVSPGDATVSEGSSLRIAVQVRGWNRGDTTQIRYATDDGQTSDKTVAMLSEIEGLTYFTDLGKGFGGIVQPMKYFVEAGDAKAGPFAIKIQAVPLVLLEQVEYAYPAYTRLAPRTTEGDGRIEAPEGTRVTIRARSNQLMKKSRIEFNSNPGKENTFHVTSVDDVLIDDRALAAELLLKLDDAKSNPTLLNYRILAANSLGEENAEPIVYPIKVIPDLAPEVQLASDLKDSIELPVNQKLNLEVRASDPDFGLVRLAISGVDGNQSVVAKELFRNAVGANGLISEVYTLDPQLLHLRAGSQLDLVATGEDNRMAIGSDQPEPNVRQSRTIRVTITQPSQKTPDAGADKANTRESSSKSERGDAKPEKENGKNPSQETQSPKNDDSTKSEVQSKNEEGKPESQPRKESPKQSDKGGDEGKSSKTESQSDTQNNPKNPAEENNKEKSQSGGSQEENKADPKDAEQGKSEQGKSEQGKSEQGKSEQGKSEQGKSEQGKSEQGKSEQGKSSDPSKQDKPQQGQSGAGESGAGQSGNGEKQGGQSSSGDGGGSESSSGQGNESGSSNTNERSKSNRGPSQRGEPMHDGEAFEELKEMLKEDAASGETKGAGQSTKSDSTEKSSERSSTPNDSKTGEGTSSDTKTPAGSPDPNNSKKDASGNPTKDSSNSRNENSSGKQPIDPKSDSAQGGENGGKSKSDESSPSMSDSQNSQNRSDKSSDPASKGSDPQSGKGDQSKGGEASSENSTSKKQTDSSDSASTENNTQAKPGSKSKNPGSESETGDTQDQQGKGKSQNSDGKADKPNPSNGEKGASNQERGSSSSIEKGASKGENGEKGDSNAEKGSAKQSSGSQGEKEISASDQQSAKQGSQDGGKTSDQPGDIGKNKESSSKGSSQSKNSKGNQSGKDSPGSDSNSGENPSGDQASPPESNVAETEYARQATDMVLKALDRQRDQPDPELLKRMGWSKEQMQAFIDRWKNARDQAASDPKKKRDYDEALRSLGLIPTTGKAKNVQGREDQLRGLNEEGSRVRPPEALREPFEAFRRSTIPK